jgi:hypothetical protein
MDELRVLPKVKADGVVVVATVTGCCAGVPAIELLYYRYPNIRHKTTNQNEVNGITVLA